jgi:CO/xanthine dehydrogenase Mo-binding subunit
MTTRYFGERIKRNEDPRLLTGQGLYVDDVDLPNMLHAAFLRSPYAHARINTIDVSQALQREGVVTPADRKQMPPAPRITGRIPGPFPGRGGKASPHRTRLDAGESYLQFAA